MAETIRDISDRIATIETDLSRIMQLLAELSRRGYAVEPKGIKLVEGMVFAASLEVTTLASAFIGWSEDYRHLARSAKTFIQTVETEDAGIRELTATVRRTAVLLTGARSPEEKGELLEMIRQALEAVDARTVRRGGEEPAADAGSNVVPFRAPAVASSVAPEGGAA